MIDELFSELSSPDLLIFLEGPLDLSSSGGVLSNKYIVNALSVKISVGISTEKTAAVAMLLKENLRHESVLNLYGTCIKILLAAYILGDYHRVTYMLIYEVMLPDPLLRTGILPSDDGGSLSTLLLWHVNGYSGGRVGQ